MARWILPFMAGAATIAVIGTSAVAVVQHRDAQQAQQRASAAEAEVADLRARVAELEDETDQLQQDLEDAGSEDPFGDLFGGLLGGGAGDLDDLGGLLDGALGGGDIAGMECIMPGGGAGDLLGGMLGGEGGDVGDLDGLLEGLLSGEAGALDDPDALLEGLLGGGGEAEPLPDDPQELVAQVAEEVAELRELSWTTAPEVAFLGDDELRRRLGEVMDEDYPVEDAQLEGRYLAALGAVPADTDMGQLRRQLLEEQVAGFYDPDTGELVVRTPSGVISAADRVVLAHELDHALTDQALGLPELDHERFAQDQDALLAALSVVEGDATLLMNHWALGNLGFGDQMALATDPAIVAAQAAMDDMPAYLGAELVFPYTTGLDHVCDRWQDDGWSSVDAAYANLPTTSATVLWPDHPGAVGAPDELTTPAGYEQAHTTTFGAAHLLWLLEAPGDEPSRAVADADERAQAWGGGQMTVWFDDDDTAVGLALLDRGTATDSLCDTVTGWYAAAFPDSEPQQAEGATTFDDDRQAAVIACPGDQVRVGIAPELDVAVDVVS